MLGRIFIWTGIGCAGLFGLFVLLGIVGLVFFSNSEDSATARMDSSDSSNSGITKMSNSDSEHGETANEPARTSSSEAADGGTAKISSPKSEDKALNKGEGLQPKIFEDSQGRKDFYAIYIPPSLAESDQALYGIAVQEYPGRGDGGVIAKFYGDEDDAENASCYKKPNDSGFYAPCNGTPHDHYSSYLGFVMLSKGIRVFSRSYTDAEALDAVVSGWDHDATAPDILVERASFYNVPVNTYTKLVRVADPLDVSTLRACTYARFLYTNARTVGSLDAPDVINVGFILGDEPVPNQWNPHTDVPENRISMNPHTLHVFNFDAPNQASWSFKITGGWDEESAAPTCQQEE